MRGRRLAVALGALILAASSAQAQTSVQAVVNAKTPWQQTNTNLKRGQAFSISAKGAWSTGASGGGEAGPDGYAGKGSRSALLSNANLGALVGKVGPNGAPFLIGSSYSGTASGDGNLFLAINDDAAGFADNQGRVSVAVSAGAAPGGAQTATAVAPKRPSGGLSLSLGGVRLGGGGGSPAATETPTAPAATNAAGVAGRTAPSSRTPTNPNTPPSRTDGGSRGGVTFNPQITIPLGAIFGGGRKPSTQPEPEPTGQVATTEPPTRLPPTRPPSTQPPSVSRPPLTVPTATIPPRVPPSSRPPQSPTPPPIRRPPGQVASTIPSAPEAPSTAPPPTDLAVNNAPTIAPEPLPPALPEPTPAPAAPVIPVSLPQFIPPQLIAPVIGGGALLLLFMLIAPKIAGQRRPKVGAASVSARIVNHGVQSQDLTVTWKARR